MFGCMLTCLLDLARAEAVAGDVDHVVGAPRMKYSRRRRGFPKSNVEYTSCLRTS
jgi:hypothetical protein